jgi:hypothetical protein
MTADAVGDAELGTHSESSAEASLQPPSVISFPSTGKDLSES